MLSLSSLLLLPQEALARNPDLVLYGLAWTFPQWVLTAAEGFASAAVGYLVDWVEGAEATLGRNLTYLGFHNESPWEARFVFFAGGVACCRFIKSQLSNDLTYCPTCGQIDVSSSIIVVDDDAPATTTPAGRSPGSWSCARSWTVAVGRTCRSRWGTAAPAPASRLQTS